MFGFYSKEAAELFGTCIYRSVTGQEVEVTGVYGSLQSGEKNYLWKDKVFVGEVREDQWREGRSASAQRDLWPQVSTRSL